MLDIFSMRKANGKLRGQIDSLLASESFEFSYVGDASRFTESELEGYLKKFDDIKNKLESKVQYSLVGITLSITLIFGLTGALSKYATNNIFIAVVLALCSLLSVGCLIIAGMLAMHCIGGNNESYIISPEDLKSNNLKQTMGLYIELNMRMNMIRNNLMYTSYSYIKYAIITLSVLFLVIILANNLFVSNTNAIDEIEADVEILSQEIESISITMTEHSDQVLDVESKLSHVEESYNDLIGEWLEYLNSSSNSNDLEELGNDISEISEQLIIVNNEIDSLKKMVEDTNLQEQ